jgi:LCP family protein required for cell wall assembly
VISRADSQLPRGRLVVLLAAVTVGVTLIAAGVAVRAAQGRQTAAAASATQTASAPSDTPLPTFTSQPLAPTDTLTPGPSSTMTLTATPSSTPTRTPVPSATRAPTDTPWPTGELAEGELPTPIPTRQFYNTGEFAPPILTPSTIVPPPATPIPVPEGVINVLLMGSDHRTGQIGNTDVMIIVSVDLQEGTVNMLSIPRDLLVFVPGWAMSKLNTVYAHGQAVGWRGGGFGLMQETLMYNFGIYVGHYALVDLTGFRNIVDVLGGVDVPVDCTLQGYTLIEPRLRQEDFATYEEWVAYTDPASGNWEWYTLPIGVHHLDGYMALWYARYRYGTSDFDRAFRQHQVLRALAAKARGDGLLTVTRIPQLWREYNQLVETSMDLGNLIQFMPIAADLDAIEIRSFVITSEYLIPWDDPSTETNDYYLLPKTGVIEQYLFQAMQPPAHNYVVTTSSSVEVRNGTTTERLDEVGADRLRWRGLNASPTGPADGSGYTQTVIYDFTGSGRSTQLQLMQAELRVSDANVISQPDPARTVDYVVVLGADYQSCRRTPQVVTTPTPPTPPTATTTPTP